MSVPKSVVKIRGTNVTYTSSVDFACYNIYELSRAAMRDVGKFLANSIRAELRKLPGSKLDKEVKQFTAGHVTYKVPYNPNGLPFLQVGIKPESWYTEEHELGSSTKPKFGVLNRVAHANVAKIIEIESKYLSALEDEARALSLIDEGEHTGGGEA